MDRPYNHLCRLFRKVNHACAGRAMWTMYLEAVRSFAGRLPDRRLKVDAFYKIVTSIDEAVSERRIEPSRMPAVHKIKDNTLCDILDLCDATTRGDGHEQRLGFVLIRTQDGFESANRGVELFRQRLAMRDDPADFLAYTLATGIRDGAVQAALAGMTPRPDPYGARARAEAKSGTKPAPVKGDSTPN